MRHVYLVTGATSGIGEATAAALAARGDGTVLVHGRDRAKTDAVVARLPGRVEPLIADLADLDDVRRLAAEVLERYDRLDVLVNNAALGFGAAEPIFITNHLAPFLLTNLLRGLLVASAPARVVTVASAVHRQVREVPWDQLGTAEGAVKPYETSKLLNVLFTRALARRLAGTRVTANAADPGFVRTGLGRGATGMFKVFLTVVRPFLASAEVGAQTSVFLATDPTVAEVTGGYFAKSRQVEPSALALDDEAAERAWQISERLTER